MLVAFCETEDQAQLHWSMISYCEKSEGYRISHYLFHFSVAVLSSRMSALRWRLLIKRLIRQEHKPPVPGPLIGSKYGTLTELGPDSTCAFVGPLRARPARTHPPHRNIPYHTSYRHKEPEHLSPNFVWAVRHAQTFCHTNSSSLCSGSFFFFFL